MRYTMIYTYSNENAQLEVYEFSRKGKLIYVIYNTRPDTTLL